jgi:8-oxo-dGTP pyrophosphatase MutT (NUDIX family)
MQPPKRDTRVQIAIIENGRVILLNHYNKIMRTHFWGLPGGGVEFGESEEQAALREAEEETGLKVQLLPYRIERLETRLGAMYKRYVTFLAYPVEGEARLGGDPEPEMTLFFELQGLRWQSLQDDTDLDEFGLQTMRPVRELAASPDLKRRAGALVLRPNGSGGPKLLVVTSKVDSNFWVLPQGKLEPGESPEQAAKRETFEESGVEVKVGQPLGFYFNQRDGKFYRTDIFQAAFSRQGPITEPRQVRWVTAEEAQALNMGRETSRIIRETVVNN